VEHQSLLILTDATDRPREPRRATTGALRRLRLGRSRTAPASSRTVWRARTIGRGAGRAINAISPEPMACGLL
jgi:hypothetical protein